MNKLESIKNELREATAEEYLAYLEAQLICKIWEGESNNLESNLARYKKELRAFDSKPNENRLKNLFHKILEAIS